MTAQPEYDYRKWDPKSQERLLQGVEVAKATNWKPFYCPNVTCDGRPHGPNWDFPHAREDQRPPNWKKKWLTWLLMSGRGSGKTRTGSEVTNRITQIVGRIALIGPTGPDIRETMVEGPSGILACAHPTQRPTWNPSRKILTWPNGAIAQGFSGEEPDRIRGGNFGAAWIDEPAHIDLIHECWPNLKLTLRERADYPNHIICTTTPKPSKWMKELVADPKTITVRVSTYANLDNLSSEFRDTILESFEGTRWGRQELHGEILEDVEGSLWKAWMIKSIDHSKLPELDRIVIAVDPAGSCNPRSDETGIIGIGIEGRHLYVLADRTGRYSPDGWAQAAHGLYEELQADCIVAEKNYGGEMVKHTLESVGLPDVLVKLVDSRRGKKLRAEPMVALYEKDLVTHVSGMDRNDLVDLENEQVEWVPGKGPSPNRVDALVHGAWELVRGMGMEATIADPNKVMGQFRAPTSRYLN
jgi:phage terminase large subunit-like protein